MWGLFPASPGTLRASTQGRQRHLSGLQEGLAGRGCASEVLLTSMMSLGAQAPSIPRALGHLAPCRDAFPRIASRIARVVAVGGTTAPAASLRKVTDLPGSTHLQSAWISASGAAFDGIFGDILSRNIERGPAHIRATARGGLAVSGDHHAQRLESEARTRHGVRDVKQFLIMGDESSERRGSGARLQGFWGVTRGEASLGRPKVKEGKII